MCVCAFITSVYVCIEIERGEGVVEGTFTEREEREKYQQEGKSDSDRLEKKSLLYVCVCVYAYERVCVR